MFNKLSLATFFCVFLCIDGAKGSNAEADKDSPKLTAKAKLHNSTGQFLENTPDFAKKLLIEAEKQNTFLKKFDGKIDYGFMQNILHNVSYSGVDKRYSRLLPTENYIYTYGSVDLSDISQIKPSYKWCSWEANYLNVEHLHFIARSYFIFDEQDKNKHLFWILQHPIKLSELQNIQLTMRKDGYVKTTLENYKTLFIDMGNLHSLKDSAIKPEGSPRDNKKGFKLHLHGSTDKNLSVTPLFTNGTPRSEKIEELQVKKLDPIETLSPLSSDYSPSSSGISPKSSPESKPSPKISPVSRDRGSAPRRQRNTSGSKPENTLQPQVTINKQRNTQATATEPGTPPIQSITIPIEVNLPQTFRVNPTSLVFNLPETNIPTTFVFSFQLPAEIKSAPVAIPQKEGSFDDELNSLLEGLKSENIFQFDEELSPLITNDQKKQSKTLTKKHSTSALSAASNSPRTKTQFNK